MVIGTCLVFAWFHSYHSFVTVHLHILTHNHTLISQQSTQMTERNSWEADRVLLVSEAIRALSANHYGRALPWRRALAPAVVQRVFSQTEGGLG